MNFSLAAVVAALLASQSDAAFVSRHNKNGVGVFNSSFGTSSQLQLFGFLNEGKKALVKKIAGDYDEAAIQARIDKDINNNQVLMYSFTT
jgi:hypothetical protein